MSSSVYIPNSLKAAGAQLRLALSKPLEQLPKASFVQSWCSIAYLYPGLHPDGFEDQESGWPRVFRRFAAEAWRRAQAGEIADEELYPSDASWSGIYDRMILHLPEETERRLELASEFGR